MATKKPIDWDTVKNEYISDSEASFRSLSEKYGISASAIHRRAKEGDWARKREDFENRLETKTLEKLLEERAKGAVKRLTVLFSASDKLEKKVLRAVERVDIRNTLAIRQLTSTLKDLSAMEGITPAERDSGDGGEMGVVVLPEISGELIPPEDKQEASEDGNG